MSYILYISILFYLSIPFQTHPPDFIKYEYINRFICNRSQILFKQSFISMILSCNIYLFLPNFFSWLRCALLVSYSCFKRWSSRIASLLGNVLKFLFSNFTFRSFSTSASPFILLLWLFGINSSICRFNSPQFAGRSYSLISGQFKKCFLFGLRLS